MAPALRPSEAWKSIPWKKYQRNVFRLQKRIYRAKQRGDVRTVHNLQRLLLRSRSARFLAVRRVSQDNRGKKTPGVDGVASLTYKQRLRYTHLLRDLDRAADPVRRTYLPKPNSPDKRPLGIPTMLIRAYQALTKLALEPEWEAVFEPNSYGFRPSRSPHDAIEAVFNFIRLKPKYVLKADIEKCFDRINHQALVDKLCTIRPIAKLVQGWLKAGIVDQGQTLFPQEGVPQGGVVSPLLMNVALHGLEEDILKAYPERHKPAVIRFADDVVILHHDLDTLHQIKGQAEAWLSHIGLQLNPSKTHIAHTLNHEGRVGFDFLGFNVRQYHVGRYKTRTYQGYVDFKTLIRPAKKAVKRHLAHLKQVIRDYRGSSQAGLIGKLNPIIRGWANYYRTCSAKITFNRMSAQLYYKLRRWAAFRHPRKWPQWCHRRYWKRLDGLIRFTDGEHYLFQYEQTKIRRHIKVKGHKSPFDGDWLYWAQRLQRHPLKPLRVVKLLKWQSGKCESCGLPFSTEDVLEVHHINGNKSDNRYVNLSLLHGHCHDIAHA